MTDALYQEIILDHYKHPHGRGLRDPFAGEAHHVNPTCGDEVTVRVTGDLSDVSYDGLGCSISQASASVMHELLTGTSPAEAARISEACLELMQGRGEVEPDAEVRSLACLYPLATITAHPLHPQREPALAPGLSGAGTG